MIEDNKKKDNTPAAVLPTAAAPSGVLPTAAAPSGVLPTAAAPSGVGSSIFDKVCSVIYQMLKTRKYTEIEILELASQSESVSLKHSRDAETKSKKNHPFHAIARAKRNVKGNDEICEVHISMSSDKIGVKDIRGIVDECSKRMVNRLVIITEEKVTSFAQRECKNKANTENCPIIEMWNFDELTYNIMNHQYQPKFKPVTGQARLKIIKDYGGISAFGKMLQNDPVVRFMGLSKGTLVMIDRQLPGGQTMRVYRVVF